MFINRCIPIRHTFRQLKRTYAFSVSTPSLWPAFKNSEADVQARYREKLERKAKELGINSPDELKQVLKDEIEARKRDMNKIDPLKELEEYEAKQQQKAAAATKVRSPISPDTPKTPYKTLESYINVDKFKELGQQEIELLWRSRFASKEEALAAMVPVDAYNKLFTNARENPSFVLPLPRATGGEENGIEVHYVQWSFVGPHTTHVMITSLAEFKLHGEFARPHTSLMFHHELKDSNGVVLMNGVVEPESSVSQQEAQLLVMNLQRFYGALADSPASRRRVKLLKDFTKGSKEFSMDQLIEEAQSLEN